MKNNYNDDYMTLVNPLSSCYNNNSSFWKEQISFTNRNSLKVKHENEFGCYISDIFNTFTILRAKCVSQIASYNENMRVDTSNLPWIG